MHANTMVGARLGNWGALKQGGKMGTIYGHGCLFSLLLGISPLPTPSLRKDSLIHHFTKEFMIKLLVEIILAK